MIIDINCKTSKDKQYKDYFWYDSFFKKMIKINCLYYRVETHHSPFCIFNAEPIEIEEAVEKFKKHNNVGHLPDRVVIEAMKKKNMIHYDYIQKAIPQFSEEKDKTGLNFNKISRILHDLDLEYAILAKSVQGISIEIEEDNKSEINDFIEELKKEYEIRIN